MRINVGCGRHVLDGFVNVDVERSPKAPRAPEVLASAVAIPLEDGCADEVMAIHLLEHFYWWEVPAVLAEWRRLLKPGGLLVLELPDILKCARNLIKLAAAGADVHQIDSQAMWGLYGDPGTRNPLMCHRWGWHPATLQAELHAAGFTDLVWPPTQWHAAGRAHRDMRVEARRP